MRKSSLDLPGRPRPWVMAHRGASDLAPENSEVAFDLAVSHGADLIETDLWFSRDDQLVCHHDPTLERMCGLRRAVGDLTSAEIRRLRLVDRLGEHPPQGVPVLEAVLDRLPGDMPVMLELKDRAFEKARYIDRLVSALSDRIERGTVGIIGFQLSVLLAVRERAPQLIVGHISRFNPLPTQPTPLLGPYYPLLWLNPAYVQMAHRRGARVCPLDPGLHRRLARYMAMDVDAVLTNDPRETRRRIEALR